MARAGKVCLVSGCPYRAVHRGRCEGCASEYERKRGSGWDRYDAAHRAERARLLPRSIGTRCSLCGEVMQAGQPLDLHHSVARATGNTGPGDVIVHASCNRALGAG